MQTNISHITCQGASVSFTQNSATLRAQNGTTYDIEKQGRLHFLNNTVTGNNKTHTVEEWHRILGHCNARGVRRLEGIVDGMKITDNKDDFRCDICVMGKMYYYNNMEPDKHATHSLELVHCDLAGSIDPVAKYGFKYSLSFVDDFSGINMIYFLRQKSDTTEATIDYWQIKLRVV